MKRNLSDKRMEISQTITHMAIGALITILLISMCSCTRFESENKRRYMGEQHYRITQYSGGRIVNVYWFNGILNNQENSDGFYWFQGDTLMEVSGPIEVMAIPIK